MDVRNPCRVPSLEKIWLEYDFIHPRLNKIGAGKTREWKRRVAFLQFPRKLDVLRSSAEGEWTWPRKDESRKNHLIVFRASSSFCFPFSSNVYANQRSLRVRIICHSWRHLKQLLFLRRFARSALSAFPVLRNDFTWQEALFALLFTFCAFRLRKLAVSYGKMVTKI